MRFMMLVIPKGYETAAPGTMPDPKAVERMMKYNEELQKAGVLLALDGLHPPSIQVRSKAEAIEWAQRAPMSDNEIIEVRQVQEITDFPPEIRQTVEKADLPGLKANNPG